MEVRLGDAYFNVYCSCKEILKNKESHFYCNMLDLLTNTCKATEISNIEKIEFDDLIQFWLMEILPLVFDEDCAVQSSAIIAMEEVIKKLDIVAVHKSSQWPKIKEIIINYAQRIHNIRNDNNYQWQQIWCLIIRILDKEIVKNARTINAFLTVVELGFRSPDHKIRTQAFVCWRTLIGLFAKYNELTVPKRLKLICIPLKSSQSKSEESAIAKFRVWWYLITCLGQEIGQLFDVVVEPFLVFLFGSVNRQSLGAVHQYKSVRVIALLSLADLFDVAVDNLMEEHDLECFGMNSTLSNNEIITKYWDLITTAIFSCLQSIDKDMLSTGSTQKVIVQLLEFLFKSMSNLCLTEFYVKFCEFLVRLLPEHTTHVAMTMKLFANAGNRFLTITHQVPNIKVCWESIISMFAVATSSISEDIISECIKKLFTVDFKQDSSNVWPAINLAMDVLNQNCPKNYERIVSIKFRIWRLNSQQIIEYIGKHPFECRTEEHSTKLNQWITWPLIVITQHNFNFPLDKEFCTLWRQLLDGTEHCFARLVLLNDVNEYLNKLLPTFAKYDQFPLLLTTYANAVLQLEYNGNEQNYKNVFEILRRLITAQSSIKTKETCLELIKCLLSQMELSNLVSLLKNIKIILKEIALENGNKKYVQKWKQAMMQNVCCHLDGELKAEYQNIFCNKDDPVVISSVWSFNPEKLTEKQRERFESKTIIPALYNDLSVSQDTSLKPWTPSTVKIAGTSVIVENKSIETDCTLHAAESVQKSTHVKDINSEILPNKVIVAVDNNETSDNKPVRRTRQSIKTQMEGIVEDNSNRKSITPKRKFKKNQKRCENENKIENTITEDDIVITAFVDSTNTTENRTISMDIELKQQNLESSNCADGATDSQIIFTNKTELTHVRPNEVGKDKAPIEDTEDKINIMLSNQEDERVLLGSPTHNLPINNIDKTSINLSEVSPKRCITKLPTLLSPPDRKLTSNHSSPSLRQKHSSYLTGRGAQLINMIRNKRADSFSPCPIANSNRKTIKVERPHTPMQQLQITGLEQNNVQHDILTFSKPLPSPTASPSVSILKRKALNESSDETFATELHTSKKKRVSFHDPPVSITKEYLKDASETKIKPKRCLILEKPTNDDHSSDSKLQNQPIYCHEINQLCSNVMVDGISSSADKSTKTDEAIEITDRDRNFDNVEPKKNIQTNDMQNFDFIMDDVPLGTILNQSFKTNEETTIKLCNAMVKFLSKQMNENPTVKANVLEDLSENHSKDFLDYAIRENLSTVVCDRLNVNSVIDYVCAKSKINTSCRSKFLVEIPDILKQIKLKSELLNFLKTSLQQCELSDIDILNMITTLISLRDENKSCSSAAVELTADSSSNL